eukprot:CAMPEP_0176033942 /NCGR_PEP_ID=MMETSP0120_2-20121206/16772_1 /TAXON_ID=160619 /ORGANISM="Kryptoperidinium foliaceum, Strain CCMP 1326" /LENGTH=106 /DNA_ID=CAMNT_0017367277 /DNA_START=186 /DNA_END=503 /DNA_ORIENTATION=-
MSMVENYYLDKKREELMNHESNDSLASTFSRMRLDNQKRKRRVAFDDQNVCVAETVNISDLTPAEYHDYWFGNEEFQSKAAPLTSQRNFTNFLVTLPTLGLVTEAW